MELSEWLASTLGFHSRSFWRYVDDREARERLGAERRVPSEHFKPHSQEMGNGESRPVYSSRPGITKVNVTSVLFVACAIIPGHSEPLRSYNIANTTPTTA